jgi:hypothetical protein
MLPFAQKQADRTLEMSSKKKRELEYAPLMTGRPPVLLCPIWVCYNGLWLALRLSGFKKLSLTTNEIYYLISGNLFK